MDAERRIRTDEAVRPARGPARALAIGADQPLTLAKQDNRICAEYNTVMPGLGPGIHVFFSDGGKIVDGRAQPGHDGRGWILRLRTHIRSLRRVDNLACGEIVPAPKA